MIMPLFIKSAMNERNWKRGKKGMDAAAASKVWDDKSAAARKGRGREITIFA